MNNLQSIEIELAACRKAWKDNPKATWAWCCHHMEHCEPLIEPAENRIAYILSDKPKKEQAVRLRNFRPVRVELPEEVVKTGEAYAKAREARDKAREAYVKAEKAWLKAGEDYDKAREAHKSQLAELHNKDWPDHTWYNENILQ